MRRAAARPSPALLPAGCSCSLLPAAGAGPGNHMYALRRGSRQGVLHGAAQQLGQPSTFPGQERRRRGTLGGRSGAKLGKGKVHCLREEESLLKIQDYLSLPCLPQSWLEILYACVGPSSLCISTHRPCLENLNYSSCMQVKLCVLVWESSSCQCLLLPTVWVSRMKRREFKTRKKWKWVDIWGGGNDSTEKSVQKG